MVAIKVALLSLAVAAEEDLYGGSWLRDTRSNCWDQCGAPARYSLFYVYNVESLLMRCGRYSCNRWDLSHFFSSFQIIRSPPTHGQMGGLQLKRYSGVALGLAFLIPQAKGKGILLDWDLVGAGMGRRTTFQGPHTNSLTSYRYRASRFLFLGDDVIGERIRPAGQRLLLVMGLSRVWWN